MTYRPSSTAERLGFFDDKYLAHPRSRWSGCRDWMAAHPDAVPERIRKDRTRIKVSPAKIAKLAAPLEGAAVRKDLLPVEFVGEPWTDLRTVGPHWRRSIRLDTPHLWLSQLSLAIDADYAWWVERLFDRKGSWLLRPANCEFGYFIDTKLMGLVMGVSLDREHVARQVAVAA